MGAVVGLIDAMVDRLEAVVPGRVFGVEPDELVPPYVFVGRVSYDELQTWGGEYSVVVPVVAVADGVLRASSAWLYDTTEMVIAVLVDGGLVLRSAVPITVDAGGVADVSGAGLRYPAQLLTFAVSVSPPASSGPTPL